MRLVYITLARKILCYGSFPAKVLLGTNAYNSLKKNLTFHLVRHTFEKRYKEVPSGFRQWDQLWHADKWLLFPENIGPKLAIDESSLSNGELYTFVTNRDARTRERSLVAIVAGTKSEDIIAVLERIDDERRHAVKEVTLDLSDSMRKIVRSVFPKASRVIDRFHIQKLACDAVQELRVKHRWEAIQQANDEMEEAKLNGEDYVPFRFPNGDTRKELLIRSRYLLFKSAEKWTGRQKQRAAILFEEYPDIRTAYGLCHSLRMIFSKKTQSRMPHVCLWQSGIARSKKQDSIPLTSSPRPSMSIMMKY